MNSSIRLLIISKRPSFTDTLEHGLWGFIIEKADSVPDIEHFLRYLSIDLCIWDLDSPDALDDFSKVQKHAAASCHLGLISRDPYACRADLYNRGFDSILIKPAHLSLICATIFSLVRRRYKHASSRITYKELALDIERQRLYLPFSHRQPSGGGYRILERLALTGQVTHHETLLLHYGGSAPNKKLIDVYICKLRRILGPCSWQLQTSWGNGYFLTGDSSYEHQRTPK